MTLVDLVKKLKAIQEAHPMLRTFGEGDIYDYVDNGGEIQYPVLWTVVRPSVYSGTTMRYDLVWDRVYKYVFHMDHFYTINYLFDLQNKERKRQI